MGVRFDPDDCHSSKNTHAELPEASVAQWATCVGETGPDGAGAGFSLEGAVCSRPRAGVGARLLARPRAITRHGPHAPRPTGWATCVAHADRAATGSPDSPDTAVHTLHTLHSAFFDVYD